MNDVGSYDYTKQVFDETDDFKAFSQPDAAGTTLPTIIPSLIQRVRNIVALKYHWFLPYV